MQVGVRLIHLFNLNNQLQLQHGVIQILPLNNSSQHLQEEEEEEDGEHQVIHKQSLKNLHNHKGERGVLLLHRRQQQQRVAGEVLTKAVSLLLLLHRRLEVEVEDGVVIVAVVEVMEQRLVGDNLLVTKGVNLIAEVEVKGVLNAVRKDTCRENARKHLCSKSEVGVLVLSAIKKVTCRENVPILRLNDLRMEVEVRQWSVLNASKKATCLESVRVAKDKREGQSNVLIVMKKVTCRESVQIQLQNVRTTVIRVEDNEVVLNLVLNASKKDTCQKIVRPIKDLKNALNVTKKGTCQGSVPILIKKKEVALTVVMKVTCLKNALKNAKNVLLEHPNLTIQINKLVTTRLEVVIQLEHGEE